MVLLFLYPFFNPSVCSHPALFVLLAMAIYTGVTLSFLGKRFGDWRFSWSYILGWVAMLMTFFAGDIIKPHRLLFKGQRLTHRSSLNGKREEVFKG